MKLILLFALFFSSEKSFWIQDVYAVPEDLYRPSSLSIAPEDISSQFLRKCSQDSFYKTLENPSDFCQKSVMSLTVNHNNGALKCDCSRQGSVGGRNAICEVKTRYWRINRSIIYVINACFAKFTFKLLTDNSYYLINICAEIWRAMPLSVACNWKTMWPMSKRLLRFSAMCSM